MKRKTSVANRHILAALAIALLVSSVIILIWWPTAELQFSCCLRGGIFLAAAWLAYDDIQRLPGWLLATLPVFLIILIRWPRYFLVLVPVVIFTSIAHRVLRKKERRK